MTFDQWISFATLAQTLARFIWDRWCYDAVVVALPLILIFWPFGP